MRALILISIVICPVFAYGGFDLAKPKVVVGDKTLLCASIEYSDKPNVPSQQQAQGVCNSVQDFYSRNSRNLLRFKVKGVKIKVPYKESQRNWDGIKKIVHAQFPNMDYYDLIVGPRIGSSHAGCGGKPRMCVAFLYGLLPRDSQHEIGHLLGLGHAGRYIWEKGKKDPTLESYKDGESVMGRFVSTTLTGPQYRWLSWLPKSEVAVYSPDDEDHEYEVKRITDTKSNKLSLVGIPMEYFWGEEPEKAAPDPHRDAFISFPKQCDQCLSLHLSMGGGSQKVASFGEEYHDDYFTGIHVTIISKSKTAIKFKIDWDPKPANFDNETIELEEGSTP